MTTARHILTAIAAAAALTACTIDSYDKGEGEYSLMTADFVEAATGSDKQVKAVITDEGERLTLTRPVTASWIDKADTTYRAALYYNKVVDGGGSVEPLSLSRIGVLVPHSNISDTLLRHPLHIESAWTSKTGHWLNLRLRLMTGSTSEEDARHVLGIVSHGSTPTHAHLTLYHDQGGRPEYYSTLTYASIPLDSIAQDTITLHVTTYDGEFQRTFTKDKQEK